MRKTDKLSKNFLFFRKLTQIAVNSRVLEKNYHKNSHRYIVFNFDPKNNYFRLKSEIFAKKVQNWHICVLPNLTSRVQTHRKLSFWEILYHLGDENTFIVFELFIFFIKKVSLFVSHQYTRF